MNIYVQIVSTLIIHSQILIATKTEQKMRYNTTSVQTLTDRTLHPQAIQHRTSKLLGTSY